MAEMKLAVAKNTQGVQDVTEKVAKVADEIRGVTKARQQDKTDIIGEATKRMSAELRERESKKDNLVIHGLFEPDPELRGVDRKNADLESLRFLFEDMGAPVDTSEAIKFSFRPGQMTEAVHEKPRPLCIGLHSSEAREKILQKARHLAKSRDFYNVSIIPDLTVQQRNEDRDLMKEAEMKNSDMPEEEKGNWVYRCIGMKGKRTIARMKVHQDGARAPAPARGGHRPPVPPRGGPRPQGLPRGATPLRQFQGPPRGGNLFQGPRRGSQLHQFNQPPLTGANSTRIQTRNRDRSPPPPGTSPPPPGTFSDTEEEEENHGWPTVDQGSRQGKRLPSRSPSMSPNSYPTRPSQNQRKRGRSNNLHFGAANL
jgi:hypothetical protein